MWKTLKRNLNKFLEMFKEAGIYSINRVLPGSLIIVLSVLFIAVTVYLVLQGKTWTGYGELVTGYMTAIGICATWLTGNKITNSKYNTNPGAPGKPLGPMEPNEKVVAAMDKLADKINKRSTEASVLSN